MKDPGEKNGVVMTDKAMSRKERIEAFRATKKPGIYTKRSELISSFNPFELDKLILAVAAAGAVVLWLTESPLLWWVGAYAWFGMWMLEREAKVRAGVSQYHEERIEELEAQVSFLMEESGRAHVYQAMVDMRN
jgi:hypothetical protein